MTDIQIKNITDLPGATEDQGGTIYIDQGGSSKKAAVKSAIWKDAKAAGSGTAGDVPTLDSAGAVSPADGGTGASISQATLNDAANAGKAVTVQRTGSTGSLGIGGISVNAIDADSLATEAEILEPTPGDPKLVTNTGLNDKIEEIETVLEHSWGDWSSTSTTDYLQNSNLTSASSALIDLAGIEDIVIFNSSLYRADTLGDNRAELYLSSASVTHDPNITPNSAFKGGVIFIDGDGRRWFYTQGTTELFADSNSQDFYYYDTASSSWVYQGPHGDALRTSVASLPDDGKWYPISEKAHDAPFNAANGDKFNEFDDFPFIAKRSGTTYYAMRIAFQGSPSERFAFIQRTREFTGVIGAGAIGDGTITHPKLAANAVEADNISAGAVEHEALDADAVETDNVKDDAITQAKIADNSVGLAQLKTTNVGTDGQSLTRNADGELTFVTVGGGSGTSTPTDLSVTLQKFAPSIYASEEEVLNDGTGDQKLVGASVLKELLDDVDNEASWKPWSDATQTNKSDLTGSSWSGLDIGDDGTISIVNTSSANMGTYSISTARPVMFGPDCTNKPSLSAGELYGFLAVLATDDRRFALTVGDTNVPDSEAVWEYANGSWTALGYRGNELKTSYGSLRPNETFEVFSSLAVGRPSDNAFNDEVAVARSDGKKRYALRVAYSTANPAGFRILTSTSDAAYVLQNDEVETATIKDAAVTHDKLAADSVDTDNIRDDAITSSLLGAGAVDHAALGLDAVQSDNIQDGAVGHDAMAADAIEADNVADNAIGTAALNATGTAATDKWVKVDATDTSKLSYVDAPSGGMSIGGTQAAGKIIRATSSSAQSWVDAVSYEDIIRFSTPVKNGDTNWNISRNLPAGKDFSDYAFLVFETKYIDTNVTYTYQSPMHLHNPTIGSNNIIIGSGGGDTDANAIQLDLLSTTTWKINWIPTTLDSNGEGLSAIIGVKL